MSNLTSADLRYRIDYVTGAQQTVQIIVADRAAADAISRKHGYAADAHELRMYAAASSAARRENPDSALCRTWEDFARNAVSCDLVDTRGRPVKAANGVYIVDDEGDLIGEDPTQPGM